MSTHSNRTDDGEPHDELPVRIGPPPVVTGPQPHAQRSQNAPESLQQEVAHRILSQPFVHSGPSGVSVPGALAFILDQSAPTGPDSCFQTGREFAHLHPPTDGSLHMTLPAHVSSAAFRHGWGVPHPVSGTPMIFGPRDDIELEVIWRLLHHSYQHALGANANCGNL